MSLAKSVRKRIRITKNGKVVRRRMGVDHFRTTKNGKGVRSRRTSMGLDYPLKKLKSY